jgi:cytochrome bd-type quinol oxidase subunit 1
MVQGLQVSVLWPHFLETDGDIFFGRLPFAWSNLATRNAVVSVVIVGVCRVEQRRAKFIHDDGMKLSTDNISPYLVRGQTVFVDSEPQPK